MAKTSGGTRGKAPASNPNLKGVGNTKLQLYHESSMDYRDAVDHIMDLTGADEGDANNLYWAINDWSGSMYEDIRAAQQGDSNNKEDLLSADRLERFIRESPKWDGGTTWRGLDISESFIAQFKIGQTFDPMGLSSWSSERDVAEGFAGTSHKFLLRCDKPQNGTSIKFASNCPSEDEVLTSGRCRYKITKITRTSKDAIPITIVDVEPIANKRK